MAHMKLPEGLPGILGLFAFRSETSGPMKELAEVLLRGPSSLTAGERELIASYVSFLNKCQFCTNSHSAAAKHLLNGDGDLVDSVKLGYETANISPKLKFLLKIAGKVQKSPTVVDKIDIENAKGAGATDQEIHDTVLISAAFCMYNRYVDGLGTWAPSDKSAYDDMGKMLAQNGYREKTTLA